MSDTANVIAGYVAELEAKRTELRLQREATECSERENLRLSGLLKESQREADTLRESRETWKAQAEALLRRLQTTQQWLERFQGLAAEKGLEVLRLEGEAGE